MNEQKINDRLRFLEALDESVQVKHLPRSQWPPDLIKNKILLWQVPRTTGELLYYLVKEKQPKTILELGTSAGYSALWMKKACPQARLHTVEFSEYRFNLAKESFAKAQVTIIQYQSKIEPVLRNWSEPLDFVFIDADKLAYLENFKLLEPHLTKGAIVVVDNMLDSREKTDNLLVYARSKYRVDLLPVDNGLVVIYLDEF